MKIFVTGGTGKLGTKIVELLIKNEHQVVLLTRNRHVDTCENIEGDLFSFDTNVMKGCDAVVHIAGLVDFESKEELFRVNVEGTREIVKRANECEIPYFIHISSISVYGKNNNSNITENTKLNPDTLYAKSKYESELELNEFKGTKCILRPGMIYGPGFTQGFDKALKLIKKGNFYTFGQGTNYVPLVSVDLVSDAVNFCLNEKKEGIYNVIDKEIMTQNEILKFVSDRVKVPLKIYSVPSFLSYLVIFLYNIRTQNKIPYEYIQMLNTNRKVSSQLFNVGFKTKNKLEYRLGEFVDLLNVE